MNKENCLKNCTVLYVEDEKEVVEIFSSLLIDRVKDIYVAYDGEEGLEKYKEFKPDIVISDVMMPKLNGLEMLQAIKELNTNQKTVLVTAYSQHDLLMNAIEIGVDKYILKPLENLDSIIKPLDDIAYIIYLEEQQQKINKINAMKDMLHSIAHHWRQPLSIISTYSSMMLLDLESNSYQKDTFKDAISSIIQTTQTLSNTITNFINIIDNENVYIKDEIEISSFFEEILLDFEERIKSQNIKIINNCNKNSFKVNKQLLKQVLTTIITNSIEAITRENITQGIIKFDVTFKDKQIIISILDNANGIKKDVMTQIFQPYFSSDKIHSGTGLGLYLANEITKQCGGKIEVSNEKFEFENHHYKGACFTLTLNIE